MTRPAYDFLEKNGTLVYTLKCPLWHQTIVQWDLEFFVLDPEMEHISIKSDTLEQAMWWLNCLWHSQDLESCTDTTTHEIDWKEYAALIARIHGELIFSKDK